MSEEVFDQPQQAPTKLFFSYLLQQLLLSDIICIKKLSRKAAASSLTTLALMYREGLGESLLLAESYNNC
jgi:hypothetical protein